MTDVDFYTLFSGLHEGDERRFLQMERFYLTHKVTILGSLPWLAAELAENDGFWVMTQFVKHYGGGRLYINKSHAIFLEKIKVPVSEKTHKQLISQANISGSLDIPSAWGIFITLRKIAIQQAITECIPARKVANCFGVTERYLRYLNRKNKKYDAHRKQSAIGKTASYAPQPENET